MWPGRFEKPESLDLKRLHFQSWLGWVLYGSPNTLTANLPVGKSYGFHLTEEGIKACLLPPGTCWWRAQLRLEAGPGPPGYWSVFSPLCRPHPLGSGIDSLVAHLHPCTAVWGLSAGFRASEGNLLSEDRMLLGDIAGKNPFWFKSLRPADSSLCPRALASLSWCLGCIAGVQDLETRQGLTAFCECKGNWIPFMKLVDLQHQALLFRTGALEGMSNESNPEVGGSWGETSIPISSLHWDWEGKSWGPSHLGTSCSFEPGTTEI